MRKLHTALIIAAALAMAAYAEPSDSTRTSTADTSGSKLHYSGGAALHDGSAPVESAGTVVEVTRHRDSDGEVVVVKETSDTVFLLKRSEVRITPCDVKSRIGDMRLRGVGGSMGFHAGVNAVNIRPVEDFAQRAPMLRGRDFGFSSYGYEPFLMSGGVGYGGIGNGVRLGFSGMQGDWDFRSAEYGSPDSMVVMNVDVGYGGLLIERAFTSAQYDVIIGGILGLGHMRLKYGAIDIDDYSSFDNKREADLDHEARAHLGVLELHGGFTWSPSTWVHLGGELSAPVFFSVDGFAPYTGEFVTVNPGLSVRVVFGNLG